MGGLYLGDCYRTNLSNLQPYVYIVMTPGEEDDAAEIVPFLVTASPHEAEGYTEDSEQIVEGVPMPPEMVAWVKEFIAKHHVEVAFKKRKRKPYDPRKSGFHGPKGPLQCTKIREADPREDWGAGRD